MILAILSRVYSIRKEFVFSLRYLFGLLNIPLNKTDRRNKVVNSINSMLNTSLTSETNINDFIFIPYTVSPSQYLIITDLEVDTILKYDRPIDKYSLFNTYATIKRYVNHNTKTSFPSISRIMTITNIVSNNTVMRYVDILEELELIKCTKGGYVIKEGKVRRSNNTYEIV